MCAGHLGCPAEVEIDPRRQIQLEKAQKFSRGGNSKKFEKALVQANHLNYRAFSASELSKRHAGPSGVLFGSQPVISPSGQDVL
jgi:hypothetical protein